jgi:hypothetical protein
MAMKTIGHCRLSPGSLEEEVGSANQSGMVTSKSNAQQKGGTYAMFPATRHPIMVCDKLTEE